jgi:PAS domain-containing protein
LSQPPLAAELGRAPLVVFEVDGNLAGRPVSGDTDGAFCEAIGRLLSRCRQGQDEALSEHYRTALRERSPSSFRLVLEESAPARFVDVTLVPPNPEAPAAARLLAIFRDVTLQVQTEQKSHNDTQRLFAILEQLPGFCYTVDRNLVFTSSEGAGLTHLNLTDGQVVGMRLPELWGTEDLNYEPMACHHRALEGTPGPYPETCMGRSLE